MKSKLRRSHQRGLVGTQPLETRVLLAGNVSVKLTSAGNLIIKGDQLDNSVSVAAVDGGIQVTGFSDADGQPTTVNRESNIVFAGEEFVSGNLKVQMKGGDDEFLSSVDIRKNVNISTSGGSDFAKLEYSTISGDVKVALGATGTEPLSDYDCLDIENTTIAGNAVVKGGKGPHGVGIFRTDMQGEFAVSLGAGDDYLDITHSTAAAFNLNGGRGEDDLRLFPDGGDSLPSKNFEIFR